MREERQRSLDIPSRRNGWSYYVILPENVAGIVNSNRELMEELEYLAENAGIYLEDSKFRGASVRLFANNDSYDMDEETLQTVNVILKTMQKRLESETEGNVWFYQRNYMSQLVVFEGDGLKQACELLGAKKLTIEEIAAEVGYNSVYSFRRAFKRVYGISPREHSQMYLIFPVTRRWRIMPDRECLPI